MKREKFLWPLTQSHHRALLTAKRVKEKLSAPGAGTGDAVKEMAAEVQKLYDEELRLHFWNEEKILALYEEHMGRSEPEPGKIRREHRFLEYLMRQADWQSLLAFAETLTTHVRFEEDVLFGMIEKALSEAEKQAVGNILSKSPATCSPNS
jgi:hemerythrin-like domain-containing protein